MQKEKILPFCFLLFLLVFFSSLIALSLWIQVYPQELKSLIFYREISDKAVFYSFIKYLIISFTALTLVNTIFLIFKHFYYKKRFCWISPLLSQTKAMWPILLLFFYPLRAFVIIGSEPAWIQDQTGFYFLVYFILILSWAMYRLVKKTDFTKQNFLKNREIIALIFFFIFFTIFFGYFSILRLQDLTIEKPDIHAFMTVFWNTAHGNFLRYTYLDVPRNWFGLHFEPLIFLFVPLYLIKIPDMSVPILLQLIQVVIGASGVFPVFFLARKKLKSAFLGLVFGLVYLLFPAFQFQILYDFHIEIISLVCILWGIYFLEERRYKPFLFFLALAVFSREEFALYASFFGFYLLFKRKRDKRLGIFLLLSGVSYLLLVKSLVIPYFGQGELVPAQVSMFSHLGKSLSQIVKTFLFKSDYVLNFMFSQRKIQYLFLMFLSTGFLALLSPLVLCSLPFFAINLLLDFDLPSSILWHYQSWLIPILIWATLDFVSRKKGKIRAAFCFFILSTSVLSSLYFGPLNLLKFNLGNTHKGLFELRKSPEITYLRNIRKLIPDDKSLAVDTGLAPYFANRKDFYLFPEIMTTDYIITSLKLFKNHPQLNSTLRENGYCLKIFPGILVYKKGESCNSLWQDELVDASRHISFKDNNTEIVFTQNLSFIDFPISPRSLNLPGILVLKSSFENSVSQENLIYLTDYQIFAIYPNVVKIEASQDGKTYQTVSICSALPRECCVSRVDVSRFVNKKGEIYIKFYLFTDSLFSKEPADVRIEWLVLRNLKLVSDLKTEN